MACCVVVNQPPQDVRGDDPAENASCAASAGQPPKRPNPQPPGPPAGDAPGAAAAPPSRGPDTVADRGRITKTSPDFKEPWSKLLSLAKEKSRSRHARSKGKEASSPTAAPKEKDKPKRIADFDVSTPTIEVSKPLKPGNESTLVGAEMLPATSIPQMDEVISPLREGRSVRVTTQSKRKSRQRASSVEWDYSGSESADTSCVPQNKAKTSKRKKRGSSIEMDWADVSNSEAEEDEFDAMHKCSICNKKFKQPWRLRTHLQQHLQPEIRPFKCDEDGCSKGYFYKIHLERHKSRSHSDLVIVAQTICPSEGCNRIFKSQGGLKRHINKSHSVENLKFHCPHCDKKFSKNRQLRFHIAEHNGEPPLRCEKCNAGVFSDRDLKRHMRTHKEYPCDVSGCDKVFSTYPAFQKHNAEHNKCFQSLKCAHCNREFKMRRHLRNHVLTHLDERTIFKCSYDSCPRFYYQERNLRSHIRVFHEKTSTIACSWEGCEKQFLSKKALTRHLNFHENGRAEMKRKEGPRATRKDKGLPKRAMATQLAGMLVHRGVEKILLAPDRTVKVLDCREKSPDGPTSKNKKSSSRSKLAKSMKNTSTSVMSEQDKICSTDSVDVVNEDNVVILQDEGGVCPLPVGENDSIISSLTGKVFEIGKGGILIEVEKNSHISDATSSDLAEENTHPMQSCSLSEKCPNDTSLPENEQYKEPVDGVVIDLGDVPLIFDSAEENVQCQQTGSLTEDCSDKTALSEKMKTLQTRDEAALIKLKESSLKAANMDDNVSSTLNENSFTGKIQPSAKTCLNTAALPEKENETNLPFPEENLILIEINESDKIVESNVVTLSCDEKRKNCGAIPLERPVTPTTIRNIVKLVSSPLNLQADEVTAVYESGCTLSATLCAETIVDGPHGESEAILLIPGQKLSAGEASSARVDEVLDGDMEVYSVAGKNANEGLSRSSEESTKSSPVKRVRLDDPSVASILQPLLQELAHKPDPSSSEVKKPSKPVKLIRNPAHFHNFVRKSAKFICANVEMVPSKGAKSKSGRSLRNDLEGPTQDATHSDSSSVSESDGSRSDSGSDDDQNDYNGDDSESDDSVSSDGDGGNEDDEDGDDEDEVDDQPDDDSDGEDEDGDDENGNDGAGQVNGNDNNNNNNNDNNESNPDGSEEQQEPDPTNGHQRINDGSDLGVDRASSPKQNAPSEDDDVRSTHSDDLIIDIEACENEKDPADKASLKEVEQETATNKSPPKYVPSPEKDYSKVRRRSSRLKELKASKITQEDVKAEIRNAFAELLRRKSCFTRADNCIMTKCNDEVAAGKENEIVSVGKKNSRKKQQQLPVRIELKRKSNKGMEVLEKSKNRLKKVNTCESDSSSSDVIQPCKKRRCNIGDDDSDSSVPQKIDDNLSSPANATIKEENDADLDSSQDSKSSLQISLKDAEINLLASLKSLPNRDGSPVKNEKFLLEPKTESRISIGCSQLSEIAWIRVLRQASKVMKLSLTAAED